MSDIGRYCLRAAVGLLVIGAAQGQDDQYIAALKVESNYSSWPAGGALKQGLNFSPVNYPALAAFTISSESLKVDYLAYGVVRTVQVTNGSATLFITIGVGLDTVLNGHELFLRSDATNRDQNYFDAYIRGDLNGITIGDLSFVLFGSSASNVGRYIAFLRRNVFCAIADDPVTPSGVNLGALASQIDTSIINEPDRTTFQFDADRPVINTFSPASTTLSASAGGSTTATIAITDPTGNSGPLTRKFLDGGNLDVTDSGGPTVVISATSTPGSLPLTLVAVNAFLQFSSATVTFTVTP